jgi:5-methyltetrahydrofolate--homocysteine methyltransferase
VIHFFGLWSNRPYTLQACDFNALISPRHFQEFFLPDIARQAATVGRAFFHLDGPRAANHIDALLEVRELEVIQFTPGAGAPSALAWVELFRKIQEKGKSVLVICPSEEVLELCDALDPSSLAVIVEGDMTVGELDDLHAEFCRRFT